MEVIIKHDVGRDCAETYVHWDTFSFPFTNKPRERKRRILHGPGLQFKFTTYPERPINRPYNLSVLLGLLSVWAKLNHSITSPP